MKLNLIKKIVLFIEVIILLILFVGGSVAFFSFRNSLQKQIYSQLQSIALLKKNSINMYLKTGISEIEYLAEDNSEHQHIADYISKKDKNLEENLRSEFLDITKENKSLSGIMLLDSSGNVLVSTDKKDEGKIKSGEQFFEKSKEKTVIQDYYFDVLTNAPAMFVATPLKDKDRKFIGVLMGKIDISEINQIVISRSGLGSTGETFLINSFNMVVTDLAKETNSAFRKTTYSPETKECLNGNSTSSVSKDYHGEDVVGYWSWFPELKSCMITKMDTSEALYPVRKATWMFILVMVILGLLAGISARFGSDAFLGPLKKLRNEIIKVKGGDFNVKVDVNSKDEIGDMALVFNDMAKNLSEYKKNIENEVTSRTIELKNKVDDLEKTQKAVSNLIEDIEKEKKISESQSEELEKFKLVIDSTSEHIIITNPEGTIIYANPAVTQITGYSHDEVIGQKPSLWGKQMPEEFYIKMWQTIKEEKRTFSGEIKNKRKNGEIYDAKSMISPIVDENGDIKFYVGIELDISKEKALEKALIEEKKSVDLKVIERTKELKEERARLLSSINSIPFGFIIADSKNNIIMKNNAMMDIFHFDGGKNISLDDMVGFFDKDFNLKVKIDQCSKNRQVCELDEITLNDKIFKGIIAPIVVSDSAESENIGYILLLEDITEEKIVARSKDEFFAVASHELRTPLTAIRGNSSMLLDLYSDKVKDKEASEMLQDINDASKRLIGIVNDFLDASRLEQGRIELKSNKFELSNLIDKTIKSVDEMANVKNLSIKFKPIKGDKIDLFTDEGKVEQVLMNLLGNAIKFTKEGKITVNTTVYGNFVKISVSDTGPGISTKNEKLLFRKFQPAGEHILTRDVTKSTGLGLYISRLLVSKLGGTIGLEKSTVGEGSTFFFTLPIGEIV